MRNVAPRSTRTHCGSLNALDHRVPPLPSTAALAGNVPFSSDDASAGLFSARFGDGGGGGGGAVPPGQNVIVKLEPVGQVCSAPPEFSS